MDALKRVKLLKEKMMPILRLGQIFVNLYIQDEDAFKEEPLDEISLLIYESDGTEAEHRILNWLCAHHYFYGHEPDIVDSFWKI